MAAAISSLGPKQASRRLLALQARMKRATLERLNARVRFKIAGCAEGRGQEREPISADSTHLFG
jgi:hypothetical protein